MCYLNCHPYIDIHNIQERLNINVSQLLR
ncbi:hypothetical protein KPSB59_2030006 [Klebsiella quasipneumoniae subsp. quasipneumoniae]|nr:hypothetical protein KPSB59_2030006 [Klebsiella quasipneumoniae subsp. quasipneumoniae]